jgi:hypothetical protein
VQLLLSIVSFIDTYIEGVKRIKRFSNGLYAVYCPNCFTYEYLPPKWLTEEKLRCPLCGTRMEFVDDVFRAVKARHLEALKRFVEHVLVPVVLEVFGDDLEWWRGVRRALHGDANIVDVFKRYGIAIASIHMGESDFVLAIECDVPELLAEFDRLAMHQPERVLRFVEALERQRRTTVFRAMVVSRHSFDELKKRGFAEAAATCLKCVRKAFAEPVLAKTIP